VPLPPDKKARDAVRALRRIRAVDSPTDAEGLKAVWHQGATGVELISHVTAEGRLRRQELTLLEDYLVWTSEGGLATGRVRPVTGLVELHPHRELGCLRRAEEALSYYLGEDKYVLQLRRRVTLALQGEEAQDEPTVTRRYIWEGPPPNARLPGRPLRWKAALVAGGLLLVGGLLGALASFLR
jgi:hypothetical protein